MHNFQMKIITNIKIYSCNFNICEKYIRNSRKRDEYNVNNITMNYFIMI